MGQVKGPGRNRIKVGSRAIKSAYVYASHLRLTALAEGVIGRRLAARNHAGSFETEPRNPDASASADTLAAILLR